MKKIYLISVLTVLSGLLFVLAPGWFEFLWGWQLLLLPFTAGMLMVLVQNEDKSYNFILKLIIGSFLTSFVFVALWQSIEYDYDGHFIFLGAIQIVLFFSIVCIFGGLVGIVIRGITLLIKKYAKHKRNKIFGVFGALIVIFILLVLLYRPVIFQEGNPWPQIKGMVQLKFDDSDIVKLSGSDNRFMTESKNGTMIHDFMKTKGYEFTEQMGSGYFFKSTTGQTAIATHRYYSRYYSLWTITEDIKNEENNIFNELRECLLKSDMTSHERCNELLATIRNFDDCVNAGFSIMKSSPPQCATLDGRNFTDETNSDWNIVLAALKNCEVERVFQTHSKLVILKLKNGDKVSAYEPQIDDVMKVVESLNGKCGDIIMATE